MLQRLNGPTLASCRSMAHVRVYHLSFLQSDVQKVEQETSELSSEGLVVHTPFIPTSYPNRKADLPADMPKLVLQTPAVRDAKMTASVTPAYNAGTPGTVCLGLKLKMVCVRCRGMFCAVQSVGHNEINS